MEKFNAICSSIEDVLIKNDLKADDFTNTLDETREDLFKEIYPKAAKQKDGK
jgi:hypothetical protein